MNEQKSSTRGLFWIGLAAVIAAGLFFRFWNLGVPAFRADTIQFWALANRPNTSLGDMLTRWYEVTNLIGQMPLAGIFMKLWLWITHLPVTPFNVRAPFALFGLLAVPMAYLAGHNLYGRNFGLLLAAFIAFNTFAVYLSREAYVYAPILFGYFLYTAALFDVRAQLLAGNRPRAKSYIFFGLGIFFCTYSQITGAFIVGTGALYLFWLMWRQRGRFGKTKPPFAPVFFLHLGVVLPLFVAGWGYGPLLKQILDNVGASKEAVSLQGGNPVVDIPVMILRMSWGTSPAAFVLTGLALAGVLHGALVAKDRRLRVALFFVGFQVVVFAATRNIAHATFEARYLSGAFPFLSILWVAGLMQLPKMIPTLAKPAPVIGGVFVAAGVTFFAYPSFMCTQLLGKPVPYREIVRWADANLPEKAPVLPDRWFESWNEMRAHPGTNAIFTFTVPSEPLAVFQQFDWRASATNFFGKFHDAAYLEVAKTFHEVPTVGPWKWPAEFFGHHHVISNTGGLILRELGLAPRGDFMAANSNRVVVELYWNTREDMIAKFQKSGRSLHWLFAGGWGYANSGAHGACDLPMNMPFHQWRVLNDSAKLELINLGQQSQQATLSVFAVVIPRGNDGGAKTATATGGASQTFPAGQMTEWKIPVTLPPGTTILTLADPLWATSKRPLYVDRIEIK